MASDSNTGNPSSLKPHSIAGTKGKAVVSSTEKSGDAGVARPAGPDLQSVSEDTERIQVQPLSGKPYFSRIMCKSHVQPPFQAVVPKSLAPFLPPSTVPAMLTWRGRSWDMRFTGGRQIQRLEAGWRGFALDNGLRLGDGCVFELEDGTTEGGTVKFSVQVLRADIPLAIRERAGGYTSSNPIEID